jgi:hypothetical protein
MSSPNVISFSLGSSMNAAVDFASKKSTFDLVMARVSYVLLDDSNKEKFTNLGGWKAIGTIECRPFINFNNPESDPVIARPISSNITRYPLVNEIVVLKVFVSKQAQNSFDNYKPEVYYTDIVSLFNAPEENAAPDESYLKLNPNEKYVTGKYNPSGEIKRLIKAPGDITIEGRRGNSIRFGSNMEGFRTPWVAKKNNPIFVISNNQAKTADASARFESINDDGSTLMMMSGHNVSFQPASANFDSYNTTVTIPDKNNMVVTDQQPKAQPQESLKQEDQKPIEKDTPVEQKVVSTPVSASMQSIVETDEEQLPEREDLLVIGLNFEEVPVALGTSGEVDTASAISKDEEVSKNNTVSTGGNAKFKNLIKDLATQYNINYKDLLTFIRMESTGLYEKAVLYRKNKDNKGPGKKYRTVPTPGYSLAAVGLIQFTKPALKCIGLSSLDQILGTSYEYQVGLMKKYFACNKSQFMNADRYSLYAGIFYPILASKGKIVKPDSFVLGSEISDDRAVEIGLSNPLINKGLKITVASFKRFVDTLF